MLVPDLRPLSVGEIIDVAIKIWRRHFSTLARIVFIVVAPLQILAGLVAASVSNTDPGFDTYDSEGNPTIDGGAFAGWVAGMFTAQAITALAFLIASAAVLRAVSVAYLGGTPDWKDSLRGATGRLGSIIWLGFLSFAGLAASAVALFIPAVWLGVAWSVAFPVLIAEGTPGTQALRRSFRLVRGRWWPAFGTLALAFLFQFFVGMIVGIPLAFLTAEWDGGSAAFLAVSTIVNVASSVITTPFMAAVLVLMYFDLRVRKEGFDLELLSQGVGIPGTAIPPTGPWAASGPYPGGWSPPPPSGGWAPPPSGGGSPGAWGQPAGGWPAPAGWPAPPPPPGPPPDPPTWAPSPSAPPPGVTPATPTGDWPPTSSGIPRRGGDADDRAGDRPPGGGWEAPIDPTGGWGPPPAPAADPDPAEAGDGPSGESGDDERT